MNFAYIFLQSHFRSIFLHFETHQNRLHFHHYSCSLSTLNASSTVPCKPTSRSLPALNIRNFPTFVDTATIAGRITIRQESYCSFIQSIIKCLLVELNHQIPVWNTPSKSQLHVHRRREEGTDDDDDDAFVLQLSYL